MGGLSKPHLTGQTVFPLRKTTEPTFQDVPEQDVRTEGEMSNQLAKEAKLLVGRWINRLRTAAHSQKRVQAILAWTQICRSISFARSEHQ